MSLFKAGSFRLHSGNTSDFLIDCEALTDDDLDAISLMLAKLLPPFGRVEGVPNGGLRLAEAMGKYAGGPPNRLVVADDVLTTGSSMEEHRAGRDAYGAVIFARGPCPSWVTPLFAMTPKLIVATETEMERTVRKSFEDVPLFPEFT